MEGLFTQSLPSSIPRFMISLAKDKMAAKGFVDSAEQFIPEIQFLSEDVKTSKHNAEWRFTNFLRRDTSEDIRQRILAVMRDPFVATRYVDTVRINDRIKNCLSLYVDALEQDVLIFKSDIRDAMTSRQAGVRVFTILDLPGNNPDAKVHFKIILIDPFHLVITSQHDGLGKTEMERLSYNSNRGNTICISELLKVP